MAHLRQSLAALWLPPRVKPDQDAIAAVPDESVPHYVVVDVNAMFSEMAAYRPLNPHWHLPTQSPSLVV